MIRKAFKMKLYPGKEAEYKRRHDELWPQMKQMIHPETLTLFAVLQIEDEERWAASAQTEICRKWWDSMAELMETNPDNSPVSVDLIPVFYLK